MKVKIGTLKVHDNLNSAVWEDFKLKEGARKALLSIADEFYKFLEIDAEIKDIKFTGSLANFNYTSKSDIDLHLVVNFEDVDENIDLVKKYFDTVKNLWNNIHDISIRGYEVELYVENEGEAHISTGMFSVLKNEWIVRPKRKVTEIDTDAAEHKAESFRKIINSAITMQSDQEKLRALKRIKQKIKKCANVAWKGAENLVLRTLLLKFFVMMGH